MVLRFEAGKFAKSTWHHINPVTFRLRPDSPPFCMPWKMLTGRIVVHLGSTLMSTLGHVLKTTCKDPAHLTSTLLGLPPSTSDRLRASSVKESGYLAPPGISCDIWLQSVGQAACRLASPLGCSRLRSQSCKVTGASPIISTLVSR